MSSSRPIRKQPLLLKRLTWPVTRSIKHIQTDAYIISYPKCGRTWLRVLLGKSLALHVGHKEDVFGPSAVPRPMGVKLPQVSFTHDWARGSSPRPPSPDYTRYRKKKVVFLARDPRDAMVSYYFHVTHRTTWREGDTDNTYSALSEFIRTKRWGIERMVRFLNEWYRNRAIPADFLLVRYEDLVGDTVAQLERVTSFLDLAIRRQVLTDSAAFADFANLRKLSTSDRVSGLLRPTDEDDPNTFKVRRGKVGGYVDYFDPEDIEFANLVLRHLDPAFGYS